MQVCDCVPNTIVVAARSADEDAAVILAKNNPILSRVFDIGLGALEVLDHVVDAAQQLLGRICVMRDDNVPAIAIGKATNKRPPKGIGAKSSLPILGDDVAARRRFVKRCLVRVENEVNIVAILVRNAQQVLDEEPILGHWKPITEPCLRPAVGVSNREKPAGSVTAVVPKDSVAFPASALL